MKRTLWVLAAGALVLWLGWTAVLVAADTRSPAISGPGGIGGFQSGPGGLNGFQSGRGPAPARPFIPGTPTRVPRNFRHRFPGEEFEFGTPFILSPPVYYYPPYYPPYYEPPYPYSPPDYQRQLEQQEHQRLQQLNDQLQEQRQELQRKLQQQNEELLKARDEAARLRQEQSAQQYQKERMELEQSWIKQEGVNPNPYQEGQPIQQGIATGVVDSVTTVKIDDSEALALVLKPPSDQNPYYVGTGHRRLYSFVKGLHPGDHVSVMWLMQAGGRKWLQGVGQDQL